MSSDDKFQEKLSMGINAENIVYEYMTKWFGLVEDMRQQKHGEFSGPCLVGTEGKVILPDFAVYCKPPKESFLVDVKAKNSIYPALGKKCFTVDDKFLQYKRAVQIKRLDFLMLVFFYEGRMFFYKDSDCIGTTQFRDTTYGTGPVFCFEYDESKIRY